MLSDVHRVSAAMMVVSIVAVDWLASTPALQTHSVYQAPRCSSRSSAAQNTEASQACALSAGARSLKPKASVSKATDGGVEPPRNLSSVCVVVAHVQPQEARVRFWQQPSRSNSRYFDALAAAGQR